MAKPIVSIIVTCYNSEVFLPKLLDSIRSQSFLDWECIFVDDGSKDKTIEILDQAAKQESRFKIISKPPEGLCSLARNYGIQFAKGKYIAILDHDDLWHQDKLKLQVEAMQKFPQAQLCLTDHQIFDHGTDPSLNQELPSNIRFDCASILPQLLLNNIYCVSSYIVRRSAFKGNNLFSPDKKLVACEDFHLLLQYAKTNSIVRVAAPLTLYRNTPNSMSRDNMRMVNGLYHTAKLLRDDQFPKSIISSVEAQALKSHAVTTIWTDPKLSIKLAYRSFAKRPRIRTLIIMAVGFIESLIPKSTRWIQKRI